MNCPTCGKQGRKVDTATVKALLAVSLRHVGDGGYRFCPNADCNVVYFSEEGTQTFMKNDVRERVYQKEAAVADVLICYCFQYRVSDVHRDGDAIVADIQEGIERGQCACDWRNPQGNCCLGNVLARLKKDKGAL